MISKIIKIVLISIYARKFPGHVLGPIENGIKAAPDQDPPSGLLNNGDAGLNLSGRKSSAHYHYTGSLWTPIKL